MGAVRHALKSLVRTPLASAAVVLMLAVGIGATTAIVGVIDRLLIRPLPFAEQDRLVAVQNAWPLFQDASPDGEVDGERPEALLGGVPKRGRVYTTTSDRSLIVSYLPLFSGSLIVPVGLQERSGSDLGLSWTYRIASADYFRAMRIPLPGGRTFTRDDDSTGPRVAVIDESSAEELKMHLAPGESVLGKHLAVNLGQPAAFEIVGIVGNIRQQGVGLDVYPGFYLHALQRPPVVANLVAKTTTGTATMLEAVRRAMNTIDPDLPVSHLGLLDDHVTDAVSRRRFAVALTAILGGAALLISMFGLYSLMSSLALHRGREIGVRIALGATIGGIARLMLREALGFIAAGVALGALCSFATTHVIASMLVGVGSLDPVTLGVVSSIVVWVGLGACALPIYRAAHVNPTEVLKSE